LPFLNIYCADGAMFLQMKPAGVSIGGFMLELELRTYRNYLNNASIDGDLLRLASRQFNMCALLFSKVTFEGI
jgi:hypothetical protein